MGQAFQSNVRRQQNLDKECTVLVVVISRKNFEQNEKPSKTYQYEAGLRGRI